uniref:FLYWCH-type domain-containing protein n=1 Tax=Meloidogyne incognita TaxID=6306 RepID=A0A914LD35_MELIC
MGKNGNMYWACNKKNCKGRVRNEGNVYILTQELKKNAMLREKIRIKICICIF